MDNADQKIVKDKLRDLLENSMQRLEEKFPNDFEKIDVLKNSLYDSMAYSEIYKYKRINKIEFKKNNSAGHIIIDNSKVESAISKKNIPLNVKCKPNTVTNNVLHTPSSTGIIEGGKSFEISTNQASQNKTNENNISKIAPKKESSKNVGSGKSSFSPNLSYSKNLKKPLTMQLAYVADSKKIRVKAKEDISKSTNSSVQINDKKTNKSIKVPPFNDKIISCKNNLNKSVEIVKTTNKNQIKSNPIKYNNSIQNSKQNKTRKMIPKRIIQSGSILANTDFKNKKLRFLAIICINSVIPLSKRVNILFSSKDLSSKIIIFKDLLIRSRIEEYERKQILSEEKLKPYIIDEDINLFIEKGFCPSKTAQNSLNFISREDEENLLKFSHISQIQNVIKLIYIILNENYEEITEENLIPNLINNLFQKYNSDNFKSLFLKNLMKISNFSNDQINKFSSILQKCPKLLSSHELLKISKTISFLSFIVKEIYDYANRKTEDGMKVSILRRIKIKTELYKEKVKNLRKLL